MAQEKYLSPREILKRLTLLESRIPRRNNADYETALDVNQSTPVSQAQVNAEAQRILAFMGMFVYTPDCVFDSSLGSTTGGQIVLKGVFSGRLTIQINPSIRNSPRQVLACLAHELCHKRLEDSRVSFSTIEETEYHTDLCTIYMGLGRLILNGYNVGNNAMGYLQPDMYRHAYDIMQAVRHPAGVPKGSDEFGYDVFLSQAFQKWASDPDKHQLVRSLLFDKEREVAVMAKNTHLLRQLLDIIDSYPREGLEWYSAAYGRHQSNPDMAAYPIHTFSALYDLETSVYNDIFERKVTGINVALMSLLLSLERHVPELSGSVLRYDTIVCPFCGAEKRSDDIRGDRRAVRCGKCGHYFLVDRSLLDMRSVAAEIAEKGSSVGEETVNSAYLNGKAKGYSEGRAEKLEETEYLWRQRVEQLEETSRITGMEKYRQGLEAGKATRIPDLKKEILSVLPTWLRWFVSRYIKD